MTIRKKTLSILVVCSLLVSSLTVLAHFNNITAAQSPGNAQIIGIVYDGGRDTDNDSKYNYLDISIEVNVSIEGNYRLQVNSLRDMNGSDHPGYFSASAYVGSGAHTLNGSFYGPTIYAGRFNVAGLSGVWLYDQYYSQMDSRAYMPLSRTYHYYEFDMAASLTGRIYDKGIDTDGDGLFNKLEIAVETNVSDPSTYEVYVQGLYGSGYTSVSNVTQVFLSEGVQILNVTLPGPPIYASHGNISTVSSIDLATMDKQGNSYYYQHLQNLNAVPLSRAYSYAEFDPQAFLTGKILDQGIDEDHNGLFEQLQISVEVNVTDAGRYLVDFQNLRGANMNYSQTIYVGLNLEAELLPGLHLLNFTVYGPLIYGSQLDPAFIEYLNLQYYVSMWYPIMLQSEYMVSLPVIYPHDTFESHAFLTGNVQDRGVDLDGNGLFDNLEVDVEVNVTRAGKYSVTVDGLSQAFGNRSDSDIYYRVESIEDLGVGKRLVPLVFPGSMIAYFHSNPSQLRFVELREISTGTRLSFLLRIQLSRTYSYLEFDKPMTDVQIGFVVYPNGTLDVSGSMNRTHIYPPNSYNPKVNASLGISTQGNISTGFINGTAQVPGYDYPWQQFPYNSTDGNLILEYNNYLLDARINATVVMPPYGQTFYPTNSTDFALIADYQDGIFSADLHGDTKLPDFARSESPFNISDFTVMADYANNVIDGNVTFHTVSGFPLGDVIADFAGNKSRIVLTGYVNVIYGSYPGLIINETSLDQMLSQFNSTIPGKGAGSLFESTDGVLEVVTLDTTKTPIAEPLPGARVDYTATVNWNLTKLVATYLAGSYFVYEPESEPIVYAAVDSVLSSIDQASVIANYFHSSGIGTIDLSLTSDVPTIWGKALELVPPTVPEEVQTQVHAWLEIANLTSNAVQTAHINATYSSNMQRLDVEASLVANVAGLESKLMPILPDTVPSPYKQWVESWMNVSFCTLESFNATANYAKGVATFDVDWLLAGDLSREVYSMKTSYFEYLNLTSPYAINWQTRVLNSTGIDMSNLKVEIRQGETWETLTFEGLKLHPTRDEIDFVRFRLYKFLNVTSGYGESPRQFERLRVTIMAGFNGTHTVLLYAPGGVVVPSATALDYKRMVWENTSISSLKYLLFRVAFQGTVHQAGQTFYVPVFSNSTIGSFSFDGDAKQIRFAADGQSGSGFCNVTIPRALMYAEPSEWVVKVDGTPLPLSAFNVTQNEEYVFIYLPYAHSSHVIDIVGTWVVVPELPPAMLIVALIVCGFAVLFIIATQRRRLDAAKVKCQVAVQTLMRSLQKPNP